MNIGILKNFSSPGLRVACGVSLVILAQDAHGFAVAAKMIELNRNSLAAFSFNSTNGTAGGGNISDNGDVLISDGSGVLNLSNSWVTGHVRLTANGSLV